MLCNVWPPSQRRQIVQSQEIPGWNKSSLSVLKSVARLWNVLLQVPPVYDDSSTGLIIRLSLISIWNILATKCVCQLIHCFAPGTTIHNTKTFRCGAICPHCAMICSWKTTKNLAPWCSLLLGCATMNRSCYTFYAQFTNIQRIFTTNKQQYLTAISIVTYHMARVCGIRANIGVV